MIPYRIGSKTKMIPKMAPRAAVFQVTPKPALQMAPPGSTKKIDG